MRPFALFVPSCLRADKGHPYSEDELTDLEFSDRPTRRPTPVDLLTTAAGGQFGGVRTGVEPAAAGRGGPGRDPVGWPEVKKTSNGMAHVAVHVCVRLFFLSSDR